MSELTKRVLVALVGIPVSIGIIYLGGFVFFFVVVLLSNLALWEFYSLPTTSNIKPDSTLGLVFSTLVQTLFYLLLQSEIKVDAFDVTVLLLLTLAIIPSILVFIQVFTKKSHPSLTSSFTLAGIFWIGFSFCSLLAVRFLPEFFNLLRSFGDASQPHYLFGIKYTIDDIWSFKFFLVTLGTIWICDSFAFFIGKEYGKHKLAPTISPKKTWEGAIAGYFGAILGFFGLSTLFNLELSLVFQFLFASIVGVIGQIGDLAESRIKREFNVKDSSKLLPGHGGILDRFDSILFVFPTIVFALVLLALLKLFV